MSSDVIQILAKGNPSLNLWIPNFELQPLNRFLMKVLKYLLIVIAAIVLIFLSFGLLDAEVEYGHSITVDKPISEAWAVSQDESKYPMWLEGFQSMELLSGERAQEGSTYRIVVKPSPEEPEFVMTETLVSIQENDHVTMHFDSEMMDFEQTMTFTEEDGQTTISTDSKVMGKGIMMKSIFSMMETLGGAFTKQEAKNIEALKKLIQEN